MPPSATKSSPVSVKKFSTLKLAILRSPPTAAGAAGRVSGKVAGCTVPAFAAVSCWVGWSFQALLRKSRMTGRVKVAGAPTRMESSGVR